MDIDQDIELDFPAIKNRLVGAGCEDLLEVLLEESCYKKNGKINKSALCRRLNITAGELNNQLRTCQSVLEEYGGTM